MENRAIQDQDFELRARIARSLQATEAHKKEVPDSELKCLKIAAQRLDRLLAEAADAEVQDLHRAVGCLDRLLEDIAAGKDVILGLSRQGKRQEISDKASPESKIHC